MKRFRVLVDFVETASFSASTSYRDILAPDTLRRALFLCDVNPDYRAHIRTFIEECSPGLLRWTVRQVTREHALPEYMIWNNLRRMADALKSSRTCHAFPIKISEKT